MNKAILVGRLTKDPEIRVAGSTQRTVGRFTIAINRNKTESDFIPCVCFDKTAELLEKYFHQGDRIGAIGSIRTGSYKDKEGKTVYTTEVFVNEIEFLQDKKKEEPKEEFGIPQDVLDEDLPF